MKKCKSTLQCPICGSRDVGSKYYGTSRFNIRQKPKFDGMYIWAIHDQLNVSKATICSSYCHNLSGCPPLTTACYICGQVIRNFPMELMRQKAVAVKRIQSYRRRLR